MTPTHTTHLSALRICLDRLAALDCDVQGWIGGHVGPPVVRIAAPSPALLDHLDAQQSAIKVEIGTRFAEIDGCYVSWRSRPEAK